VESITFPAGNFVIAIFFHPLNVFTIGHSPMPFNEPTISMTKKIWKVCIGTPPRVFVYRGQKLLPARTNKFQISKFKLQV